MKELRREVIDEIMEYLDARVHIAGFVQFKSCKAYVGYGYIQLDTQDGVVRVVPIRSYDTIVGFADVEQGVVYEYGKYTATTSKQFTQICRQKFNGYRRVFIDVPTADRFYKKDFGC